MTVPSSLASLSPTDLLEEIWRVVSAYDWESAPQKPAQTKPAQAKRGREEEPHQDAPSTKRQPLDEEQLIRFILTQITKALLGTQGDSWISLDEVLQTNFVHLNSYNLHQVMDFMSNLDHIWCVQRILMEMPKLNIDIRNGVFFLSIGEDFNFILFNSITTIASFRRFHGEITMMHQIADQACHEAQKLAEDKKKQLEDFITSLWNLEKTGNMKVFLKRLCDICPIFDSPSTNFDLLKLAALHFVESVYNPSTSAYYDSTPCPDPLKAFIEHATTRFGVFTPKLPLCRYDITVCNHEFKSCPFGKNCRSVHSDYFSKRWIPKDRSSCCSDYGNRGFCGNQECSLVHANIVEFNRAVNAGAGDSKIELFKRIERECSIRIKTVHN